MSAIMDVENAEILLADGIRRVEMHHSAKFHQNRSNVFWDILIFSIFKDGGHPPSWEFFGGLS